jgi:MFS family permease
VNAASFLVSASLVVRIPARLLQSETALTRGHWRDLADGFRAVVASRPLLAVLVGWGIAGLGIGGAGVAEVFVAKNTFHAGDFGYGLIFGCIGGGMVAGSVAAGTAVERFGITRTYTTALAVMAVGFAAAAVSPDVWVAAFCCAVAGIGDGLAVVGNATLVQRGAADELRGRAVTLLMSGTITVQAVGSVLAGALMPPDAGRWVWLGSGVAFALGGLAAYLLVRERSPQPVFADN